MKSKIFFLLALVLAIAGVVTLSMHYDLHTLLGNELEQLSFTQGALLFLLLFAVGSMLLLPSSVFMLLGGACFGLGWGFVFNLAGFGFACAGAFLVARYIAHDYVKSHTPARVQATMQAVHASGWKLVAILRVSAVVPAVVINYAFGVTPLSFQVYMLTSIVFTIPICLILTYAGVMGQDFIENGDLKTALLTLSLLALGTVLGVLLRRRFVRNS